jgi:hypothetical protein
LELDRQNSRKTQHAVSVRRAFNRLQAGTIALCATRWRLASQ